MVSQGAANIFKVAAFSAGAQALLHAARAGVRKIADAGIKGLKLHHARRGEKEGGIVWRDYGG